MSPRTSRNDTLPLSTALDRSERLSQLLSRLRLSRALWAAVQPQLPASLGADVRPGSLDGETWTLLACNGSAAAKLRQLLPALLELLHQQGGQGTSIRVRVQPRDPGPAVPGRG